MPHKFVVLVDGEIQEYDQYESIPLIIDNVIQFTPEFVPPPHNDEEHALNAQWEQKFNELLQREIK